MARSARPRWSLERLESRDNPSFALSGMYVPDVAPIGDPADLRPVLYPLPPAPPVTTTPELALTHFLPFDLNLDGLRNYMADAPFESPAVMDSGGLILALPQPDGAYTRFRVWEMSLMEAGLAAHLPNVQTWRGQGIDDPTAVLAADVTDFGFHAQILSPHGSWYIDPYNRTEDGLHVSYGRDDLQNGHGAGCGCQLCVAVLTDKTTTAARGPALADPGTDGGKGGGVEPPVAQRPNNGATLRTYRTAVAATGEYTTFHDGTAALGQQAIVTSINRVSGVYETELSVRLVLVANNLNLVYTNSATDPYTNGNPVAMITENQTNVDSVIGNANYDLGHVYGTNSGGYAGVGVVGSTGNKARGVTGSGAPIGDAFWIDYVTHEMGHQFAGTHTFNTSLDGNITPSSAYEPGSGSTIMAYAGIIGSGEDLQGNSDPYFHAKNLDQITDFIEGVIPSVGTSSATGNAIPVANAGADYVIPANTPFALTGSATDADAGDVLTYNWEEYDLGPAVLLTTPDNGTSPLFRSFTATANPTRTFPKVSALLANTSSLGEKLPATTRTLNFRLTVRDNRVVGAYDFDDMVISSVNTGASFAVTAPNTSVTWNGNTTQTVTWNVAGTTANGINAAQVNILLSTDGGLTFPIVLVSATANDGSESFVIPNLPSTTARIKVQPVGNVFFDVSNVNFTIAASTAMQVNTTTPAVGGVVTGSTGTLDLNFSGPVDAASVSTSDLILSRGIVTGFTIVGTNTVRFDLAGLNSEGPLTASVAQNAISDTSGAGTVAFSGNYTVDVTTAQLLVAFTPSGPVGSLAYSATTTASVNAAADTDAFTVVLDAGQTLAALVVPGASLRPTVTVTGPGGVNATADAPAAGSNALLAPVTVGTAGTYTVTIGGLASTSGAYTLQLMLNTAGEAEGNGGPANDTIGTAQTLAPLALPGGATVRGAAGKFDPVVAGLPAEVEPNDTTGTANSAATNFLAVTSNLYQLNFSSDSSLTNNGDQDWFNIGAMQVGDILTITLSGSAGGRGTNADTRLQLYTAGNTLIIEDDDGGPHPAGTQWGDPIIYRFTVAAAGTYYIRASGWNTGTFEASVLLENTGTAPTTGGTFTAETELNDTQGTANDASTSWQQVNYLSTTTGTVSTTGDSDYFSFSLTAGDLVTFTATSTSVLEARLTIRNSGGTVVAIEDGTSSGPGANSPIYAYRVPTTGTYFAQVHSAGATGTYTLTAHRSTATALPPPSASPDYYAIALAAGETVRVGVDTAAGTPALELYTAGGALLATGAAAGAYETALTYTPTAAGTYYARVSNTSPVAYTLVATTGAVLDIESNDTFATAQPIGGGSDDVLGALTGNDDWFLLDVSQNDQISLTVDVPGGGAGEFVNTLAPRHEVYSPANVLLFSSEGGTINFTVPSSGAYRVRVMPSTAVSPPTVGEYVLRRTTVDPAPTVGSTQVNGGSIQRSRVDSLRVNFSEPVAVAAGATIGEAFTLSGPAGAVNLSIVLDGSGLFATITFLNNTIGGSLTDGNYTLTTVANKLVDAGGNLLGGGTATFYRLYGDANGDRAVNGGDLFYFRSTFGASTGDANYLRYFDYLDDGLINGADLNEFRNRFGQTLP